MRAALCVVLCAAALGPAAACSEHNVAGAPQAAATSATAAALQPAVAGACTGSSGYDNATAVSRGASLAGCLLFLAINCPAESGQTQTLVWETWKPTSGVYLPGGAPPTAWGSPLPSRVLTDQPEIDGHSVLDTSGQPVLSEIRLNKAAFDYIVQRQLYSKAAQLRFFGDSNSVPIAFPSEAMEIKAAWLILTPGDPRNSRYHVVQASYVDPSGRRHAVLAGLAGLHITSKVLPQWFWTTFEQVDNQARTDAPATVGIPADVAAFNDLIHAALPQDSVWQFYNMRGVQADFTNTAGAPTLLSNTLIETHFQRSSSCITCHGLATRGSASEGTLPFFQTTASGVQGYMGAIGAPSNTYHDAFGATVCYDGNRSAFTNCAPSNPAVVYRTLDFVWSLREAK